MAAFNGWPDLPTLARPAQQLPAPAANATPLPTAWPGADLPIPPQLPPDPMQVQPDSGAGQQQPVAGAPPADPAAVQAWYARLQADDRRRRREALMNELMRQPRPGENPLAVGARQLGAALGEALVGGASALFSSTGNPTT
jgi:hypothetical protein